MSKFDIDHAIFGAISANVSNPDEVGIAVVDYSNNAAINLYGDLRGKTIQEIVSEITHDQDKTAQFLKRLAATVDCECAVIEGNLNNKFIKS